MNGVTRPALFVLSAFLTASISAWLVAREPAALRITPSGNNPCHSTGTKLIAGGVPVWIALASCTVALRWSWPVGLVLLFVLGMSLIGLIDDCQPFSVGAKLLAQAPLFALGLFALPSFVSAHWLGLSLAFIALLVLTNAMNVVDVADGLAPGVSTVTLSGVTLLTLEHQQVELSYLALTFACATASFLFFNAAPGRLLLGDTGSLALGGLCAVLTPHCLEATTPRTVLVLALLNFVPLFEVCWLSLQRTGRSIAPWRASPHHFVYWLVASGLSTSLAVSLLVLVQALTVGTALWLSGSAHALEWSCSSVVGLGCLFWGKDKWSKSTKQRLRVHASQ